MAQTLAERLNAVRRERFVGRGAELDEFDALLRADDRIVLFLHGQGGIGKSTLQAEYRRRAEEAGVGVIAFDARAIAPQPGVIMEALHGSPAMSMDVDRHVLLIDTFERWEPLNSWIHTHFIPSLPASFRVVISGRQPPAMNWRMDPAWQQLMTTIEVGPLAPDEARSYLEQRGILGDRIEEAIAFARGNSLALAMAADALVDSVKGTLVDNIDADTISELLQRVTTEGGRPAHRAALHVAAVALEVDEEILGVALPDEPPHLLLDWLSGLSFMTLGQTGVFPHDLVRDLLMADLSERFPGRYESIARAVFDHHVAKVQADPFMGLDVASSRANAAVFALRAVPALSVFAAEGDPLYLDRPSADEPARVVEATGRHLGAESRQIYERLLDEDPDGLLMLRLPDGTPAGWLHAVDLAALRAEIRDADPVAAALWRHATASVDIPDGQIMRCNRFWGSLEHGHLDASVSSQVMAISLAIILSTSDQALMTHVVSSDDVIWQPFARLVNIPLPDDLIVEVGDTTFFCLASDWRSEPIDEWARKFSLRAVATDPDALERVEAEAEDTTPIAAAAASVESPTAVVAIDEAAFTDAVADALRNFHQSHELVDNPLLDARIVTARIDASTPRSGRVPALREAISAASEGLIANEATELSGRVIHRTYIAPAPSQQAAAEALHLGYSTYRRHLATARRLLAAELWQAEHAG